MKWYVVIYQYTNNWHIDVLGRTSSEPDNNPNSNLWFVEAVRFSIEKLGLRKEHSNTVTEAKAFEISCKCNEKKQEVRVAQTPSFSEKYIELL